MRKTGLIFGLILSLLLAACQPAVSTATQAPVPTQAATLQQDTPAAATTEAPTPGTTFVPTTVFTASPPATCQVYPAVPAANAEVVAAIDSDTEKARTLGPDSAKVVLDVFSDFQCPYCAQFAPVIHELVQKYPADIKIVYHYLPLYEIHDKAMIAAQAAEAAALQGKFWEMHDVLFAGQSEWADKNENEFKSWLVDQAKKLNLNTAKFDTDMNSDAVIKTVQDSRAVADKLNLNSTPSVIVNRLLRAARNDVATLSGYLAFVNLASKASTECPAMTVDPAKQYTATIKTEKGDIVIRLFPDKAPMAVNSFIYLAKSGWYNNNGFFRVIPDYIAQAGDPSNTGLGSPGFQYSNEVTPDLRFDKAGMVGMANAGADTNGSQFFITYAPIPNLDGKYTIFGEVISGMDVLKTIRPRNPASDTILFEPDPILSITIEEK